MQINATNLIEILIIIGSIYSVNKQFNKLYTDKINNRYL